MSVFYKEEKLGKMQTQPQPTSKKNKVIVPFYSPPPRLYGQTPADIIKEARASVMPVPAIGIKPVFTNRPFTPKDNERTLFGSIRKKSKRPPSSFGSTSSEASGQVKLPSIDSASKRKSHSIFHYSNNLSLDNLTEDYDAEALEEIGEVEFEGLPAYKKSHSCPKEGRMVKAASYNELNQKLFTAINSNRESLTKDKFGRPYPKSSLHTRNRNSHADFNKSSISTIFGDSIKPEPKENPPELCRYGTNNRGGGDHSEVILQPNSLMENNFKELSMQPLKTEKGDLGTRTESTKHSPSKILVVKSKSDFTDKDVKHPEVTEKAKEITPKQLEVDAKQSSVRDQAKVSNQKEINRNKKSTYLMEKSIATEPKSEYLSSLKKGSKKLVLEKTEETVPLEILELYETAEYYGVKTNNSQESDKDEKIEKAQANAIKENFKKILEQNLESKSPDHAKNSKEEINSAVELSKEHQSAKCEKKSSGGKSLTENIQFPMNNKKRYHVAGENRDGKEKAYEKWVEKQQNDNFSSQPTSQESWDLFWKNCYYKTNKEEDESKDQGNANLPKAEDLESLQRLISKFSDLYKTGAENSTIYDTNCQLYQLLKKNHISLDMTMKNKILKALSLFIDNEDPVVLLSLARILFYLKIDSSLTVACKMIFKVARSDSNDHLFLNEEDILELFMEGVGRASPLDYAESCVYGYGALKFLTMNYNILSRTLHMGALDLMTLHLKLINTACTESGSVEEQTKHALFQLTGVLRHVAAGEGALPLFITTNCISVICKNLELFQKDEDIVTNISRTLSLVSTNESITQVLMSVENILCIVVDLMERYKENDKILIRLAFCLGNIVEHSDLARIQLLRSDTSLSILLNLLKFYIDKDLEMSMSQDSGNNSGELDSEVIDDIIVKVIRIIANMSMNPIVGSNLSPTANEKKSLHLSESLSVLLLRKEPGMALLATLGCLNNVTYYCNTHSALIDITQGIERVLGLPSEDCQAEAARVLGNLTRHKEIRDLILKTGGVNQLIKLLTSKDQEVVRCASGALVNMLLDSESRQEFLEAKGIDKLVEAMELFAGDWSLASLAGRAIWNSCADDVSSAALHNDLEHLLNSLANSLEEENWQDGDATWEEFASIATDLLEKINSHLESPQ